MTFLKLAIRSLLYHWRVNLSVALGVAAATAVLTGALVVGDSVRESLREMTVDRLGRIDELIVQDHFFDQALVTQLQGTPALQDNYRDAVGVMLFAQATVELPGESGKTRAANVLVLATDQQSAPSFWDLGDPSTAPAKRPGQGEVILNRQLADDLGARVGDAVTIRLPQPEDIPADSPLGEKTDRIRSLPRLKVIEIIENRGLGRFSLHPRQSEPRNAFVSLAHLQNAFREPDKINAILVAGSRADTAPRAAASQALTDALAPTLDDLGLHVKHVRLTHPSVAAGAESAGEVIYDYYSLSSDRMILPPAVQEAAAAAFADPGGQPLLTYLANRIDRVTPATDPSPPAPIPYSMVASIDFNDQFPLRDTAGQLIGPLHEGEIVLTSWAAEDLGCQVGDSVRITYFLPESQHGAAEESTATFTVRAVTPLVPPTRPYLPDRSCNSPNGPPWPTIRH